MELGQIIYEGPSVLDGAPIVALATYTSTNRKTGPMGQVWILRSDISPVDAVKGGEDASVCGDCPSRRHTGGGCYVVPFHGPKAVWAAYKRGRYMKATPSSLEMYKGREVRLGAYGDPAAVPFDAIEPLARKAGMVTGYTHQIGHPKFDSRHLNYCMVSTETAVASQAHQRHGRRTFRVKTEDEPLLAGEMICPASVKSHFQCIRCGVCDGAYGRGPNVAVNAHGAMSGRYDRIEAVEVKSA